MVLVRTLVQFFFFFLVNKENKSDVEDVCDDTASFMTSKLSKINKGFTDGSVVGKSRLY